MNKLNRFDPKKTFLTYNCVDTNLFSPQNFPKENYLAYLGRLNYEKGIDIAVQLSLDSGIPLKIAGVVKKEEKDAQKLFDERFYFLSINFKNFHNYFSIISCVIKTIKIWWTRKNIINSFRI